MKPDPILTKAARLCARKRFSEAIHLLEPEVVRYHDSFTYYYILAVSCLYAGDFGGALTYFRRARELRMREENALLGLAVLHLRRGETDRAIDLYLEVLEKDAGNRRAKAGLQVLKKYGEPDTLFAWLETGQLTKLFPPLPKPPALKRRLMFPVLAAIGVVLGVYASLLGLGILELPFTAAKTRPGMEAMALDAEDTAAPVQVGGSYHYVLTRNQVLQSYKAALDYFNAYRDEAAKIEINRILESNAAEPLKNKARLILSYAEVPGFNTLKDKYSYTQVLKEPLLFRDVHLIWRGMAANIRAEEKTTSFDLLVGYDTRNTLEGIVPVRFDFALTIDPERPLEVLGRLVPLGVGAEFPFRMDGIALHQAGALEGRVE